MQIIAVILAFFVGFFGVFFALLPVFLPIILWAIFFYVFNGIGIYKMYQTLGLKNAWMAWVPILNYFAIGKVAEQHKLEEGKKMPKFSVLLVIPQIVNMIPGLIMAIVNIVFTIIPLPFISFIFNAISIFIISVITIAGYVLLFFALWHIYSMFAPENAKTYLLLSIFLPIIQPFFVFTVRNKEPNDYIGAEANAYEVEEYIEEI